MTESELAIRLAKAHEDAPKGEKTTAVHVFGLHYADEIRRCGPGAPGGIAEASKTGDSYGVELNKMLKLARHVTLKDSGRRHFLRPE